MHSNTYCIHEILKYGTCTQWNITQPLKRIHLNEMDETGAHYTE